MAGRRRGPPVQPALGGTHQAGPEDFWRTPGWLVWALLGSEAAPPWGQRWLEPQAGDGGLLYPMVCRQLQLQRAAVFKCPPDPTMGVHAIEVRSACEPALRAAGAAEVTIGDWLLMAYARDWSTFAIVMNPPYSPEAKGLPSRAYQHTAAALQTGAGYVAALLPWDFPTTKEREHLWQTNVHRLRWMRPCTERPHFGDAGKGGQRNVGWFVWDSNWARTRGEVAGAQVCVNVTAITKAEGVAAMRRLAA